MDKDVLSPVMCVLFLISMVTLFVAALFDYEIIGSICGVLITFILVYFVALGLCSSDSSDHPELAALIIALGFLFMTGLYVLFKYLVSFIW